MSIIEKIISFFKNKFYKKNKIKMLSISQDAKSMESKNNFVNSLKISLPEKNNQKRIETLTCVGDGLGIQNKIIY
jgi:hypothetical protein